MRVQEGRQFAAARYRTSSIFAVLGPTCRTGTRSTRRTNLARLHDIRHGEISPPFPAGRSRLYETAPPRRRWQTGAGALLGGTNGRAVRGLIPATGAGIRRASASSDLSNPEHGRRTNLARLSTNTSLTTYPLKTATIPVAKIPVIFPNCGYRIKNFFLKEDDE